MDFILFTFQTVFIMFEMKDGWKSDGMKMNSEKLNLLCVEFYEQE